MTLRFQAQTLMSLPYLFRNKRATGVEIIPNLRFQPNADATKSKVIRAKRLVVISSGTFGSPQVLERSGIGAKSVLDKAGVTQLVDLPGVGENFQGELYVWLGFIAVSCTLCITPRSYNTIHHIPCHSRL